jgi:hypothetical protein
MPQFSATGRGGGGQRERERERERENWDTVTKVEKPNNGNPQDILDYTAFHMITAEI